MSGSTLNSNAAPLQPQAAVVFWVMVVRLPLEQAQCMMASQADRFPFRGRFRAFRPAPNQNYRAADLLCIHFYVTLKMY